jgi:hypothetical protein
MHRPQRFDKASGTAAADSQAFLLLGQAVWEYQEAEGDNVWERDIRKVWAAFPA